MARLVGFVLVCWLALAVAASAQAQTIHVTSSLDDNSPGTLRVAIQNASSGDTVVIDPGVGPIALFSQFGAIPINSVANLTIEGQGARSTTITAARGGSVFVIGQPSANVHEIAGYGPAGKGRR